MGLANRLLERYISTMRHGRFLSILLVLTFLWTSSGMASFCTSKGAGGMDCCKSSRPCGTGLKKPDCCRFEPASPTPQPMAVQAPPIAKGFKHCDLLASLAVTGGAAVPVLLTGQALTFANPPPLGSSPPLFLLHGSLLR